MAQAKQTTGQYGRRLMQIGMKPAWVAEHILGIDRRSFFKRDRGEDGMTFTFDQETKLHKLFEQIDEAGIAALIIPHEAELKDIRNG